jgi:cell division protease FtsH
VHESGHAIVAESIEYPAALQKLSVIARGRGRGGATIYSSSDQLMLTHLDLIKQLITTMGGVAAESFVFGTLSTGVEGDIEVATRMAHAMVAVYGMSPAIGPVAIGEKEGQVFIGRDLANMGNVAAASLELVDSETRRLVHDAEEIAKQVLALNVEVLEDLANSLLKAETLSGPSLDVYMEAVKLWPEPLLKEIAGHQPPIDLHKDAAAAHPDASGEFDWQDEP